MLALALVRETFSFGQLNLWRMALVVAAWRPRGPAIAIKLTPVVFVLFFLLRKDLRRGCVPLT